MDFKLGVYGLLSIVFIGAMAMLLLSLAAPGLWESACEYAFSNIFVSVVASYTFGMLVLCAAREVTNKVPFLKGSEIKASVWKDMTDEQREATDAAIKEYYGLKELTPGQLEPMCIAPVHDRMAKRDEFVATADYCRSIGLIGLVSMIAIPPWNLPSLLWRVPLLLSSWLFLRAYRFYTQLGTTVVFGAFLNWWRDRQTKAK